MSLLEKIIVGVDIGNSTTEVCIASLKENKEITFLSSSLVSTTGTKGTLENIKGIKEALEDALLKIHKEIKHLDLVRLNEAAPVIGDTAMETITQTIITESTMIGHNPSTPSGEGIGKGETILITQLPQTSLQKHYIALIPKEVTYEEAARIINQATVTIKGAVVQKDEAVLIQNRLTKIIPIVDEVRYIDKIPLGMEAVIEVAKEGVGIQTLSNPYGIAKLFNLTPSQTQHIIPIAKSLVGNRSAVIVRTPKGEVRERIIPAGKLVFTTPKGIKEMIDLDEGAVKIMALIRKIKGIKDVEGEAGSNVGGMLANMKQELAFLSKEAIETIQIKDILAVDVMVPVSVEGALAGEIAMEKAVAIAAMVKSKKLPMERVAQALAEKLDVKVEVGGVEAVMATLGALTTKGSTFPLALLDLGGGSTDAAILYKEGKVLSKHLAGAGNFVTMLINTELALNNFTAAEAIKKYPLAKVESLFHIRRENGEVSFFEKPLAPKFFGRVVVCTEEGFMPIEAPHSMEKIVLARKAIKKEIFVKNALRALEEIAPEQNIRQIQSVVLVGGSALDFEIPHMILEELSKYNIVVGKGEIRGTEGPRNAVATGLVLSKVGAV